LLSFQFTFEDAIFILTSRCTGILTHTDTVKILLNCCPLTCTVVTPLAWFSPKALLYTPVVDEAPGPVRVPLFPLPDWSAIVDETVSKL